MPEELRLGTVNKIRGESSEMENLVMKRRTRQIWVSEFGLSDVVCWFRNAQQSVMRGKRRGFVGRELKMLPSHSGLTSRAQTRSTEMGLNHWAQGQRSNQNVHLSASIVMLNWNEIIHFFFFFLSFGSVPKLIPHHGITWNDVPVSDLGSLHLLLNKARNKLHLVDFF